MTNVLKVVALLTGVVVFLVSMSLWVMPQMLGALVVQFVSDYEFSRIVGIILFVGGALGAYMVWMKRRLWKIVWAVSVTLAIVGAVTVASPHWLVRELGSDARLFYAPALLLAMLGFFAYGRPKTATA